MKPQTPPPPTGGFQLRSRTIVLCLLMAAVVPATWHFRPRRGPPPVAAEVSALPASDAEPAATPQSPPPGATHAAGGGAAVAGQPANVRIAAHPEESPAWAVPYGGEFWRQSTAAAPAPPVGDTNPAAPFNIGEVVARVSHAFLPADAGALPEVKAQTYTARFDADAGLGFSPHRPAVSPEVTDPAGAKEPPDRRSRRPSAPNPATRPQPDPDTEAWFRTMSVARDGQALFTAGQDVAAWSLLGNTAQGLLNETAGLVTHYEARANGVEVTWVLPQAPAGAGPLMVEAELSGLNYAGATEQGLHYADAAGVARVRVGPVTVVDAAGARWALAMAADGNRLRLEVPAGVLAQATYPMAIDPALEAEFEMDKRVFIPSGEPQQSPSVAASSSGYLVVWHDNRNGNLDIYGTRVTTAGVVSDPAGLPISIELSGKEHPSVAASSSGYLVVWSDYRSGNNYDIYGARVTTAGVVPDELGLPISTAAEGQFSPSVAAGSSGYLVVWQDFRSGNNFDIYGARVTTAGVVSDTNGLPISTADNWQLIPSVAAGSSGYLVVWQDDRNGLPDIYGTRVTTAGVVSDTNGLPISTADNWQLSPSVAASSSGYLVVWQDLRSGDNFDIYGARVTTAGVVSETNGLPISAVANEQSSSSVAAGSSGYLVVWQDNRNGGSDTDIYGTRVTTAGVLSDPNGLPISTADNQQSSPSVAASSSGYLVVWQDSRNGDADIYGARVTTAGVVSDTNGLPISTADNNQFFPSVAASSSGYLVVWTDERSGSYDIYGTRVTTAGVVSDPAGLAISTADNNQYIPSVAAGSSGYLVVWQDERSGNNSDIYGTRVTTAGVVSDTNGLPISTADNNQFFPSVAASSSGYLVVWQDFRSGISFDIYGARVTTDGVVSETNGIPIATGPGHEFSPSVTAAGDGFVVVWNVNASLFWRRLNATGQLLESSPLAIKGSHGRSDAAAAYGGAGRFLLTSQGQRKGATRIIGSLHSTNRAAAGPVVAFKAASFSVLENQAVATITVTVSGNNPGTVAVDYGTTDGTAADGDDYAGQYGTLVFPKGTTQQTFTIPIATNTLHEANETVNLTLSNPVGGATLGLNHRAVLTIQDDDLGGVLSLSAAAYSVRESTHTLTITVKRTGGTASDVSVGYATGGGTAVAGTDYTAQGDTLSFGAGETSKTFTIPILDNVLKEGNKTFFVHLLNPAGGATLGSVAAATVTILEDD